MRRVKPENAKRSAVSALLGRLRKGKPPPLPVIPTVPLMKWDPKEYYYKGVTLHDYRKTSWGHNIDVTAQPDGKTLKGFIFSSKHPLKGDFVIWKTNYGLGEGRITHLEWCGDPNDMYRVVITMTRRIVKEH